MRDMSESDYIRISYEELVKLLSAILLKLGFSQERADISARLFSDASRDGVYSHGVNRFPRFVRAVRNGIVDPQASPTLVSQSGAIERWDGGLGPGNLNARECMQRAIELSRKHGMGCVALANTNHWMRGGAYGWQAADAGMIGICWTNTMPNLPPWGASDPRLGNNPLIIAVPREQGHIVLDMAMSQFSYGAIESHRLRNELLAVPGGFTKDGELTRDPAAVEQSQRALPIGYWKGSGLALMLDLLASILSGGLATCDIVPDSERETRLSQVFMAINAQAVAQGEEIDRIADRIIQFMQTSKAPGAARVRYPGENVLKTRHENLQRGIPVHLAVLREVQKL